MAKRLITVLFFMIGFACLVMLGNRAIDYRLALERRFPSLVAWRTITGHAYQPPKSHYTIVFVGDSMTEKLGNFTEMQTYLHAFFPKTDFLLLNYGFGSTNILSLEQRLTDPSMHGRIFQPIITIPFDAIVIESFGYNPLSQLPVNEGLARHDTALAQATATIYLTHPKASIILLSTIAPNRKTFGQGIVDLSLKARSSWAKEREVYLTHHLNFGRLHGLQTIDIFHQSQDIFGNGKSTYIDTSDHMHPSPKGIYFINQVIATWLASHQVFH